MPLERRALSQPLHLVVCLTMTALLCALVFTPIGQPLMQPFDLMPAFAWAAIRFTWRGVLPALGMMLLSACIGTNPYTQRTDNSVVAWIILVQALLVGTGFGLSLAYFTARERKYTADLAAKEARLSDLMETVDLGIFMARELGGTILFWSKGAERLYGWTSEEAVGRISHDLLQTIHPIPLADIEAAVMTKGEWTGDLVHTAKDGRVLTVVARKVRRNLPKGGVVTLLEVLHDVTEERRDQAALVEMNRTLEQRIESEVAVRQEQLTRQKHGHHMQALGKIAAGVAHEFNNILQAVVGGLEVIVARPDDPHRVAQFGRVALSATERGSIITSRLLGFAGRSPFHNERIEPAMVLDALHDVLRHTLGGKVTICLDLEPQLPPIFIDKAEFETAMINLATNARDAMPDGGTITLAAAVETVVTPPRHPAGLASGDYVRFEVCDHGSGMDGMTLRRAVEPFFTTKPIGSGTGLGLSMVKGFAEQAGGGIAIDSTFGKGTKVTVWLPASNAAAPTPPVRQASVPLVALSGRVLFVDDEQMVRETLAEGLVDQGFSVLIAGSGAEALALIDADEVFDVLVTDYAMPSMDGLTLIRQARERRPDLPALILTGYVEQVGLDGGDLSLASVLSILRKPIGAEQLAAAIRAAVTLSRNGSHVL